MRIGTLLSLVKFEHTIFALPHAYAAAALAFGQPHEQVSYVALVWITVAMVGARTLGMALNRLIDAGIDARNPRTAGREIPSGKVSIRAGIALCAVSLLVLLGATSQLDPITRVVWPLPVLLFVVYPYTKRFTWACHLVLGMTIALAPVGAWLAITGSLSVMIIMLWAAVAAWIAGFDIIYATQDVAFDQEQQLHSIPARFGVARALRIAQALHIGTVLGLLGVSAVAALNPLSLMGIVVVAGLLYYEHSIVAPEDLTRVNAAFFTVNGYIGVVYLVSVVLGLL